MKPAWIKGRSAFASGARSGLEDRVMQQLEAAGMGYSHEGVKLPYVQPTKNRTYIADFVLSNGIVVETKGVFSSEDRAKMKIIRAAYPDIDIRFVFSRAAATLTKQSLTTHAKWAEDHGFPFAEKLIPAAWLAEPVNQRSLDAIARAEGARSPAPRRTRKA